LSDGKKAFAAFLFPILHFLVRVDFLLDIFCFAACVCYCIFFHMIFFLLFFFFFFYFFFFLIVAFPLLVFFLWLHCKR